MCVRVFSPAARRALRTLAMLLACAAPALAHDMGAMAGAGQAAHRELGSSAAFAPDGRLYAVTVQGDHVLLHASDDRGANWNPPVDVNLAPEKVSADGENRPKLAFAMDGAILVSWTHPLGKPYSGEIHLARAADGRHFAAPITVHRDRQEITHRFETMVVAPDGRVVVAWIDKRDLAAARAAGTDYRGAAIYAAVSGDGGRRFAPEQKIADHSCECCQLAGAIDADGAPLLMWRHVFAPNERDHALARLGGDGRPEQVIRATYDHWKLDGCPHQGPSLTVGADGVRHAVWFDQRNGEGRVFYGRLPRAAGGPVAGQRPIGGPRAAHADLAVAGASVAVVWKEFDGREERLFVERSVDGGRTFSRPSELAATAGGSDQARALRLGDALFVYWNTADEGMRLYALR